jgi:hypothetical protein
MSAVAADSSIVIAHAGHWLLDIAYSVPVVVVWTALILNWLRARRANPADEQREGETRARN